MDAPVTDFLFCKRKLNAFEQFLIHDEPHPSWTNCLSIDDIMLISSQWQLFSKRCLNGIYKRVLQIKMKKGFLQSAGSVVDHYFTVIDYHHQKIREKAYRMEKQLNMADDAPQNLTDMDGNAIVFYEGMDNMAAVGLYNRIIVTMRARFNKLKASFKPSLWNMYHTSLSHAIDGDVILPTMDYNQDATEDNFKAILCSLLKLDKESHDTVYEKMSNMTFDATTLLNTTK